MPTDDYQGVHDALAIISEAQGTLGGVTGAEIHLLGYLGCLLSLYTGRPVTDWGYGFVRSQWGAPYAAAIGAGLDSLRVRGFVRIEGTVYRTASQGTLFLRFLGEQNEHAWRTEYIEAACTSTLAMPVGVVRAALHEEPSLKQTALHRGARPLLSVTEVDVLYEQFQALRDVLGTTDTDLLVPSTVWLTCLAYVRRTREMSSADVTGVQPELFPGIEPR